MQLSKRFYNSKENEKYVGVGYKINEKIKSTFVRLIDEKGSQLGIFSRLDALNKARSSKLDLVEVSSISKPPVCKLMDYGKFKYKQKRKVSRTKKGQSTVHVKEIKFRPKTEPHDFTFKINNIKKFLLKGIKVKITITFRGREIIHMDIGKKMLKKIISEIKDYITIENTPKMEGKQLIAILSPANQKLDTQ